MSKLRTYKGVTYNPEAQMWVTPHGRRLSATSVIESFPKLNLTDDDHPELMRLKAEPYEPVVRLEDVVRRALRETRIAHVTVEQREMEIVRMIRTAFPHIDQEEEGA